MRDSPTVIGVDVGGTKVAVATMRGGRLSESTIVASEHADGAAVVDQLAEVIGAAIRGEDGEIGAVGLGVPSVIEFATGRVRSTVNLPLSDVPLREVLRERLSIPVYVDNDANCAALAEAFDDDGEIAVHDLVMLTVGTGVGGGIIINGRIYRGATGAAAEIGHHIIGLPMDDEVHASEGFPRVGSLEWLAAGRALDRLVHRRATEQPSSSLARLVAEHDVAGPATVEAAQAGDPDAVAALRLLGARLGVGVANMINIFDPEVVAIGGGVSVAGELLAGPARETAQRFILPGVGTATEIRLARSGPQAGVRGAALLAAQELEHERQGPPRRRVASPH